MKKIFLILLAIVPLCINAQNIDDVYNISATYYQGTAKSEAMGNAMGAVGQDFSSISINPAGLGLFRKTTFTFTPTILTTFTKSKLNGDMATDSKTQLSVNNFGYVGVNKSGKNTVNWAFGMNRTNNYNNNIYVNGYNPNSSLIDAYLIEISDNNIYDDVELEQYSPTYIFPLWSTYLINLDSDGGLSSPVPAGGLRQYKGVNSWGGTNEWTISTSVNFRDKVFLGFSFNMPYVNSRRFTEYKEDFSTSTYSNYWYQEEILSTTGWGINGKVGVIAYIAKWLRLGASFHTPTMYNLTDSWRTETASHLDEFGIYETFIVPTSRFNYSMITPWKVNGSAAIIFGNYGMITADYEYIDYRNVQLSAYNYDYSYYNEALSNTFKSTMNLRLGTEWRYHNYCFRGGYSFYGSPYGIHATDGFYNKHNRNSFSCGLGFTQHTVTFDFAYVYTFQNKEYNLYSQYSGYYEGIAPNVVYENFNAHNFVFSVKLKMF